MEFWVTIRFKKDFIVRMSSLLVDPLTCTFQVTPFSLSSGRRKVPFCSYVYLSRVPLDLPFNSGVFSQTRPNLSRKKCPTETRSL